MEGNKKGNDDNLPGNQTPVRTRVKRIEEASRAGSRKPSATKVKASGSRKNNIKQVPGQKNILEFYSRVIKRR